MDLQDVKHTPWKIWLKQHTLYILLEPHGVYKYMYVCMYECTSARSVNVVKDVRTNQILTHPSWCSANNKLYI
jgi:hypothetical protein